MTAIFGYSREAIRVKVKKCEGLLQPEFRKFSVDPQITSFEVLQSILGKAFDIKGEFTIAYRTHDALGHEIYLSILSDWDLDAAFLSSHNASLANGSEPSLCLRVDMKPFAESTDDWDVTNTTMGKTRNTLPEIKASSQRLPGLIMNQVERTFNMVQRALNLGEDGNINIQPVRPPLSDSEFRRFLDPVGQIVHAKELRSVIYYGGIDPSLRKVVWKHILNVYPEGMSGRERMDYMKRKAVEYYELRDTWREMLQKGPVTGDLAYTTGMVRKDVLRTDRHHRFYAGSDDNQNIASLFNILTTYALNHPKVSYCQGMSDLASPLLVTMGDEAHAYICFCALMQRLGHNFMLDGIAMTQKFTHLAEALLYYDPEFFGYLKMHQADDLLFCYRWLLLEMKREFAFEDSLRMLEVLWSSLPATPPAKELKLYETHFKPTIITSTPPVSPLVKTPRENAYTKVCALRRQSSSMSIASWAGGSTRKPATPTIKRQIHSLDETVSRAFNALHNAKTYQSLDDASITTVAPPIQQAIECTEEENDRPRSTSPLESNPEEIQKKSDLSASMNSFFVKPKKAGHFKELKERISANRKGLFSSLDKLDSRNVIKEETEIEKSTKSGRVVKNLNEFLNFAKKKESQEDVNKPIITLTSSSFDESESSQDKPSQQKSSSCDTTDTFDGSSPDDSQEYFPMTTSITRELRLELENLDRQVFGTNYQSNTLLDDDEDSTESTSDSSLRIEKNTSCDCLLSKPSSEIVEGSTLTEVAEICSVSKPTCLKLDGSKVPTVTTKNGKITDDIFVWENPLHQQSPETRNYTKYPSTPDEQGEELEYDGESGEIFEESQNGIKSVTPIRLVRKEQSSLRHKKVSSTMSVSATDSSDSGGDLQESIQKAVNEFPMPTMTNSCEEAIENANIKRANSLLPPPQEFGGGNPFLMFLCVTLLLQHRNYVMENGMDYNEMAMHFDKMVRKHNVLRVLDQARSMFASYMKLHNGMLLQNNNAADPNV